MKYNSADGMGVIIETPHHIPYSGSHKNQRSRRWRKKTGQKAKKTCSAFQLPAQQQQKRLCQYFAINYELVRCLDWQRETRFQFQYKIRFQLQPLQPMEYPWYCNKIKHIFQKQIFLVIAIAISVHNPLIQPFREQRSKSKISKKKN